MRPDIRPITVLSLALLIALVPMAAQAQQLLDFWVPNGPVNGTAYDAVRERLYIGGQFDRIGAASGAGAMVDPTSGAVRTPLLRIGPVGAVVRTVAADGAGGWFIGGEFTEVQGTARQNLAQVDASGNLTSWNPGADGPVHVLTLSGGVLYAGGAFATLGGSPRTRLGALDPASGAATAWAPTANDTVKFIGIFSGLFYVGGDFTQINATTRNHVAAINSSAALTTWNPNADGAVRAIYRGTTNIALGGSFLNVGGTSQPRLALVNTTTGATFPSTISANGPVYAFEADATHLFIGGDFTLIGGASRTGLAALSLSSFTIDASWNANLDGAVRDLFLFGTQLYLAGDFQTMGGGRRAGTARCAAANATGGAWDPRTGAFTFCVGATATSAFAGGKFVVVNFQNSAANFYHNLAAYDFSPSSPTFGRPLPIALEATWAVGPSYVNALRFVDPHLFVGGSFGTVNGVARSYAASLDVGSWSLGGFAPSVNGPVMGIDGDPFGDAMICGNFTSPAVQVALLNSGGGVLAPIPAPTLNSMISVVLSSQLFYAGAFSSVGGVPRRGFAALDYPYSSVNAMNPFPPDSIASLDMIAVSALDVSAGLHLYAGGVFYNYGALGRRHLLELDGFTGMPTSWAPNPDGDVNALALAGDRLFVAGRFSTVFGLPRVSLASFDVGHGGAPTLWNPTVYGPGVPSAISVASNRVAVGGSYQKANGLFNPYLSVFDDHSASLATVGPERAGTGLRLGVTPNPAAANATIELTLPRAAVISLDLVDVQGRIIRRLGAGTGTLAAGTHRIPLAVPDLAPGVYRVRLSDGRSTTSAGWVHVR